MVLDGYPVGSPPKEPLSLDTQEAMVVSMTGAIIFRSWLIYIPAPLEPVGYSPFPSMTRRKGTFQVMAAALGRTMPRLSSPE
jgi:hypothetical protein